MTRERHPIVQKGKKGFSDIPALQSRREFKAGCTTFFQNAEGVWLASDPPIRVCGCLEVAALERRKAHTQLTIRLRLANYASEEIILSGVQPSLFQNGSKIAEFLENNGLEIFDLELAKKALPALYRGRAPVPTVTIVDQPGWHKFDNQAASLEYVCGDETEGALSKFQLASGVDPGYSRRGSLERWHQRVGDLCRGNTAMTICVSAALAGPVLHLVGQSAIGFLLVGDSRTGKSTSTYAAASVYGYHKDLFRSWNATESAILLSARNANDGVYILDEISEGDPSTVGKVAYALINGRDRQRVTSDIKLRPQFAYRGVVIASGELTLAAHLEKAGIKAQAGQSARMVPIFAGPRGFFPNLHGEDSGGDFARRVEINTGKCYGAVGERWIAFLRQNGKKTQRRVTTLTSEVKATFGTSFPKTANPGIVDAVSQTFAVVGAVGEFAIEIGVLMWPAGSAAKASRIAFKRWLTHEVALFDSTSEAAINRLKKFLQSDSADRFAPFGSFVTAKRKGLAGFRHTYKGEPVYLIQRAFFEHELCSKENLSLVVRELKRLKWLVTDSGARPTKQFRIPGKPQERIAFYTIREGILAA